MKVLGAKRYVERAMRIESPLVQNMVTEKYQRMCSVVTNANGESIVLRPGHITRQFEKFLIASGLKVEKRPFEARRAKTELAGVKVKILPGEFVSYERGCVIKVRENTDRSRENMLKVRNWLSNRGIDIKRECILVSEDRRDYSCVFKDEVKDKKKGKSCPYPHPNHCQWLPSQDNKKEAGQ